MMRAAHERSRETIHDHAPGGIYADGGLDFSNGTLELENCRAQMAGGARVFSVLHPEASLKPLEGLAA